MYITPTDQMSTAASKHHIVIMRQLIPTNTRLLKKTADRIERVSSFATAHQHVKVDSVP